MGTLRFLASISFLDLKFWGDPVLGTLGFLTRFLRGSSCCMFRASMAKQMLFPLGYGGVLLSRWPLRFLYKRFFYSGFTVNLKP